MNKSKWFIPYRRGKMNYENIGHGDIVLQHDIGFSGDKLYRLVRHRPAIGFIHLTSQTRDRRALLATLRTIDYETNARETNDRPL